MSNLILPDREIDKLPPLVVSALSNMPREAQQDFMREYEANARNLVIAYLLHLLPAPPWSFSYAYMGKWVTQLLYWITGGGFGVWWFVNIFRMPQLVRRYNRELADRIVHRLALRYGRRKIERVENARPKTLSRGSGEGFSFGKVGPGVRPRPLEVAYDPAQLEVRNLKTGYMFDFDQQSWNVVSEAQYDWANGVSERSYKAVVSGEAGKSAVFSWRVESGQTLVFFLERVNIHAIDERMEDRILADGKPQNVVERKGVTYYRESPREAARFERLDTTPTGQRIRVWEYVNEHRTHLLRVEQHGPQEFRAFAGRIVSPFEFSDILPPL